LSFGLFEGAKLVGYAFVYVESESIFYNREEEVLYVKEIALTPGYENWLHPLMAKIVQLWITYCPTAGLEAHAQDDALAKWKRLVRFFRAHGMTMSVREEERKAGRPPYNLMRFDLDGAAVSLLEQPKKLPEAGWMFRDDITVTVLQDPRQWLSLRPEWDELLRQTADWNVFQSFDYLWEWWKFFGHWNGLRVVVIRRGDTILGVAPLMVEYFPVFGKVMRKLLFITAPMEMSRPKFIFGENAD